MASIGNLLETTYFKLHKILQEEISQNNLSGISLNIFYDPQKEEFKNPDELIIKKELVSDFDQSNYYLYYHNLFLAFFTKVAAFLEPVTALLFSTIITRESDKYFHATGGEDLREFQTENPLTFFTPAVYSYFLIKKHFDFEHRLFKKAVSERTYIKTDTRIRGNVTETINSYKEIEHFEISMDGVSNFLFTLLGQASIWDFLLLERLTNWETICPAQETTLFLHSIPPYMTDRYLPNLFSFLESKDEGFRESFYVHVVHGMLDDFRRHMNNKHHLSRDGAIFLLRVCDARFQGAYMRQNERFLPVTVFLMEFLNTYFYNLLKLIDRKKYKASHFQIPYIGTQEGGEKKSFSELLEKIFSRIRKRGSEYSGYSDIIKKYLLLITVIINNRTSEKETLFI